MKIIFMSFTIFVPSIQNVKILSKIYIEYKLYNGVLHWYHQVWILIVVLKERGQVMTCINLLALNNVLYCSHLELKLRLLEMAVTATLSDLRDSTQTPESAAQLIRWIYDLTVLDPNQDQSKRASTKVIILKFISVKQNYLKRFCLYVII